MAIIHLVRHGQASFGAEDYDNLSVLGERQGFLLGEWWKRIGVKPQRIVCGAMRRHAQTAHQCLNALAMPHEYVVDERLNEFDHHEVLVRYRPDFEDRKKMVAWLAQGENPRKEFQKIFAEATLRWIEGKHPQDYRESWPQVVARCRAAVNDIEQQAGRDEVVAVFSSGGPISAITQSLLALDDVRGFELAWAIINSSITTIRSTPLGLKLTAFNQVGHLEVHNDSDLLTYR